MHAHAHGHAPSTPARVGAAPRDDAAPRFEALRDVPFHDLCAAYAHEDAGAHAFARALGGTVGHLVEAADDAGITDAVRLSAAFLDVGLGDLHARSFDGKTPVDKHGRLYITSPLAWRAKLENKIGAPRHIRQPHDLVGLEGIVFLAQTKGRTDRITLWYGGQSLGDPGLDFFDSRGGVFAWALA
jgi:hypothetical protein